METIIVKMAECEFYASIYAESLQVTLSSHQTTLSFEESSYSALPEFYAAVVVFSVKAKAYFASTAVGESSFLRGDIHRLIYLARLAKPLTPFSILFQPYLDKIDESQSVVRGLAEMATMQRTKGMLPSAES
jgi:hypothetical protein